MSSKPKSETLSPKRQRFVAEYLVDLNASAAARRAGYVGDANTVGPRLLATVGIQRAIAEARKAMAGKLAISAERVLGEAWRILTADPRELVEHHVGCCRFCWGTDHRYQRTRAEMERDSAAAEADTYAAEAKQTGAPAVFDPRGGIGFDPRRNPNADCPECFGRGWGRTLVNDTRKLSPSAAALYAGIKKTREGIEVKMHSKIDALDRLFRHLGLGDRLSLTADTVERLRADSGLTLAERGRALLEAAASGSAPVGLAAQLMTGLAALGKMIETDELAARIAALEDKQDADT